MLPWEREKNQKVINLIKEGRGQEAIALLESEDKLLDFSITSLVEEKGITFAGLSVLARNKEEEAACQSISVSLDHEEPFGLKVSQEELRPLVRYLFSRLIELERVVSYQKNDEVSRTMAIADKYEIEKAAKEKIEKEIESLKQAQSRSVLDSESSKIKNPKKKHKLVMEWSNKENDFIIHYPARADGSFLHSALAAPTFCNISKNYEDSVVKQLQKRGYNVKTLKFSVEIDADKLKKEFPHLLDE